MYICVFVFAKSISLTDVSLLLCEASYKTLEGYDIFMEVYPYPLTSKTWLNTFGKSPTSPPFLPVIYHLEKI